jgi:hypothetical protein
MIMSRCIHCTRCTRFFEEYIGKPFFGVVNRGYYMEIDTYVKNIIDSEISATVADLCPVGALTTKPNAYTARPWELLSCYSIDILDSYCSEIRIDLKDNNEIVRILPKIDDNIFESFIITDKIRFITKVLNQWRFEHPSLLNSYNLYNRKPYRFIIKYMTFHLRIFKYKFLGLGKFIDYATLLHIKIFKKYFKFFIIDDYKTLSNNLYINNKYIQQHTKNFFIRNLNKSLYYNNLNALLLVNCNLRYELPLLNVRLRQFGLKNRNNFIGLIGNIKNNYINHRYIHITNNINTFYDFVFGKTWCSFKFIFNRIFEENILFENSLAKQNIILLGNSIAVGNFYNKSSFFKRLEYNFNFVNTINKLFNYYNSYSILINDISYINSLYLNCYNTCINFYNLNNTQASNNYFYGINIDVIDFSNFYKKKGLKIFQGFCIENLTDILYSNNINILLPTKNWLEYNAITFDIKADIKRFFKIYVKSKYLKHPLQYFSDLKNYYIKNVLYKKNIYINYFKNKPILNNLALTHNKILYYHYFYFTLYTNKWSYLTDTKVDPLEQQNIPIDIYNFSENMADNNINNLWNNMNNVLVNIFDNFYKTDIISKVSMTLNVCNNLLKKIDNF